MGIRESKLWLPNTRNIQQISNDLDVDYLVLNVADVLTGMDTGVIDTLIAPPSAALTLNWHSRLKYVTDTPVIYTWGMLILPERVMARVPSKYKEIVEQSFQAWAEGLDQRLRMSNKNAVAAVLQLLNIQSFSVIDLKNLRLSQF